VKPVHPLLLVVPALVLAGATAVAAADTSYGYVRSLEGRGTLDPAAGGSEELNLNQPLLAGDRVIVGARSRLELALADYNLARLDEGSELLLERLASSADRDDSVTVLRLQRGELQVVVHEQALGDELPRVDTPNATVYVLAPGTYRIAAVDPDWSEVVVRAGQAEVLTRGSSARLADGEAIEVEGDRVHRAAAAGEDGLERWAQRLDRDAQAAASDYVEPELRYAAAPLYGNGTWVSVGGRYGWRPHAAAGWRPYWDGRWGYTPSGLTWIDYQPWGWVTSHYGCWDYAPAYGWTWFPGRAYSPAWVYWYWGPSYVGWCPVGYYTRYYGYHDNWWYRDRFYRGTYGWAGGGWDGFSHWTFADARRLGDRRLREHAVPGRHLRDRGILNEVPRGIVTTDTRGLTPDRWARPEAVEAVLRTRRDARPGTAPGELPDVSDFIARRRQLAPEVEERVLGGGRRTAMRVDANPTTPGALQPRADAPAPDPSGSGRVAVTRSRTTPPPSPALEGGDSPPRSARPATPAGPTGPTAPTGPAEEDWRDAGSGRRSRVAVPRVTGQPTPQAPPPAAAAPQRRAHIVSPRVASPAPPTPITAPQSRADIAVPRVTAPVAPRGSAGADAWRELQQLAAVARPRTPSPVTPPAVQAPPVRRVVDGIRREARPPVYSAPQAAPRPSAPPAASGAPPSAPGRSAVRSSAPPAPRPAPQAQPQSQPGSGSSSDGNAANQEAARSRRPPSKDGG
jgi:hypothetical protein